MVDLPRIQEELRLWRKSAPIPGQFLGSAMRAILRPHAFDDVETFCLFIGHGRSGHSIIGSLLDAHPCIVIGHELNAARYVRLGFRRRQLFDLLVRNSRAFSARGRTWSGYSAVVPGGWHGHWDQSLRVVGDKKGFSTSSEMQDHPELLETLRERLRVPIRWFHVFRNPFDNVATMYTRRRHRAESLASVAGRYIAHCRTVRDTRARLDPSEMLDLCHEDFVASPTEELVRACAFLTVPAPCEWLDGCASIVFASPRRTRETVEWPPGLIARFREQFWEFPHLQRYDFDT